MPSPPPEPWLRGPVAGIPGALQPAAHAFLMSIEDCERAASDLTVDELWTSPGGAAPVGFHLRHLVGSTDRLLTYARESSLSDAQRAFLAVEGDSGRRPTAAALLDAWRAGVDAALVHLAATAESALNEPRAIGRARLPSTLLGVLFHAAEHASRHTGQVVTTAKVVKSSRR